VAKRRLPLLNASGEAEEPVRSAWQWVGFGALAIFTAWVPLLAIAVALASQTLARASDPAALGRAALLANGLYLAGLSLGALAGGYLVGRWGPADVGVRQGAAAGASAAVLLGLGSWLSSGPSLGLLVVAILTPAVAALGGRLGLRGRGDPSGGG
jgi:hypothetical protein